jgi:predicted RNase H-like HicB family nuclease
MKRVKLTAIIQKEGRGFVALCPELDIASQGTSKKQARGNLQEAVEGFFETASAAEIKTRLGTERYIENLEVRLA